MIETTYRGFSITYDEGNEVFKTDSEEYGTLKNPSLPALKRAIDRKMDDPIERAKPQAKQSAFTLDSRYGEFDKNIVEYVLGAFGKTERYGSTTLHVWATRGKSGRGTRERMRLDSYSTKFDEDTPANRKIAEQVLAKSIALSEHVEKEKAAIKAMKEGMTPAKPSIPSADLPVWER